jgi:membrane protein required for colicin V production
MNSIDIIVLIILGFFALRGFFRGMILEFFALAQIFALIVFITTLAVPFQNFISSTITPINYWVALLVGVLLVILVFTTTEHILRRLVRAWNLSLLDQVLGFFMGILFGIFFCFLGLRILLFFADTFEWVALKATVGDWINQSRLLQTMLAFLNSLLSTNSSS